MSKLIFFTVAVVAVMFAALTGFASADTGGPDDGGYRFIDSNEPDGPSFDDEYVDIRTTGTRLPCSDVDDCLDRDISIGFEFMFYGETYDVVSIGSNGGLFFGDFGDEFYQEYTNEGLPSSNVLYDSDEGEYHEAASILTFWDDLISEPEYCDASGIFYQLVGSGSQQRFIVQWDSCHYDLTFSYPDCAVNVQVQLLEGSNHILMVYEDTIFGENDCDEIAQTGELREHKDGQLLVGPVALPLYDGGASATVGIQQDDEVALEYSYDGTRSIENELAICFYESDVQFVPCGGLIRQPEPTRPPSIGGALSGLFTGQPTPLPTAPSAVAPAATSQVISPPRTGDAGLADGSRTFGVAIVAIVATLLALGLATRLHSRA